MKKIIQQLKADLFPIEENQVKSISFPLELRIKVAGTEIAHFRSNNPVDVADYAKFKREFLSKARIKQDEMFNNRFSNRFSVLRSSHILIIFTWIRINSLFK